MTSRTARVALFLLVFAGFLYLANFVVYEALAVLFSLTTAGELRALGVALGVLSGSFIAATLLGERYYNRFTRWYYTLSAVWIGLFAYLFLASVAYGLLWPVLGRSAGVFGQALLLVALLSSLYGIVHGRALRVREQEVALPRLPAAWEGRRAVWISDVHLGQLHGPSFARKVAEKVAAIPHDIVFIGGDLFDGTGAPDLAELVAPFRALSAPLGVYFVTGNHEEFGDSTRFREAITSAGIRILQDVMVDIEGVQLVGVDYRNASRAEAFAAILERLALDPQRPSILLKHEPNHLDVAQEAGISLQISGHTHRAQQWPFGYVAQLIYKGFSYGLRRYKTMQVCVSSGAGTWGPPMRVGTDSEIVVLSFPARERDTAV